MKFFENITIKGKVASLVTVLLLIIGGISIYTIISLVTIGGQLKEIAEADIKLIKSLTKLTTQQLEQEIHFERVLKYAQQNSAAAKRKQAAEEKKVLEIDKKIETGVSAVLSGIEKGLEEAHNDQARREFEKIKGVMTRYKDQHDDFIDKIKKDFSFLRKNQLARALESGEEITKQADELDEMLESLLAEVENFTEKEARDAEETEYLTMVVVICMAVFALVFGLPFSILISASIGSSVKNMMAVSEDLRAGEGDLTKRLPEHKKTELGKIGISINGFIGKTHDIVEEIRTAIESFSSASTEVNATAQNLSQAANEQAASVEETTASLEEMTASIQANAENAKETNQIAVQSAREAEEGGKSVAETVEAMTTITDKISIIEEIAYQTNLLALNAAIEAARAGEHGKGFAVVAAEVRKLAERSQQAAQEISEVASGSQQVAEKAGNMLKTLVPNIQKTAELVSAITEASADQSESIKGLQDAMIQLNSITEQNTAASEELAATAEELNGQADSVSDAVSVFKIQSDVQGGRSNKASKSSGTVTGGQKPGAKPAPQPSAATKEKQLSEKDYVKF